MIAPGKAKSFADPTWKKRKAAMMRSRLSR
jgi:hypothetical protein